MYSFGYGFVLCMIGSTTACKCNGMATENPCTLELYLAICTPSMVIVRVKAAGGIYRTGEESARMGRTSTLFWLV